MRAPLRQQAAGKEALGGPDQIGRVLRPRGLIAGVHGQLGKADIHRVHGDVGGADVAQGGAAGQVGPVGKALGRHAGLSAELRKGRGGDRVGGVALVGVVLDDDALVHLGSVVPVGIFGVIGMDGMGIVRRDEEAGGQACGRQLIQAQRGAEAQQRIREEIGVGALLGAAAHLLVVKDAEDRRALPFSGPQEALRRQPKTHCRSSSRGAEINSSPAPQTVPGRAGIELADPWITSPPPGRRGLGHQGRQALPPSRCRSGQHVGLDVIVLPVVGAAVHVDGQVRDQQQIPR